MIRRFLLAALMLAALGSSFAEGASRTSVRPAHPRKIPSATRGSASEARVPQETGRLKPDSAPLSTGATSQGRAPFFAPVTCNAQNASSPACYTATQQSRPVTR